MAIGRASWAYLSAYGWQPTPWPLRPSARPRWSATAATRGSPRDLAAWRTPRQAHPYRPRPQRRPSSRGRSSLPARMRIGTAPVQNRTAHGTRPYHCYTIRCGQVQKRESHGPASMKPDNALCRLLQVAVRMGDTLRLRLTGRKPEQAAAQNVVRVAHRGLAHAGARDPR